MLDKNSIAQLSQLKKDILATKDYAEGSVIGANGRFGFVNLDDGRTAFLNPERMQKVLPGDRVKVNVVKNEKDQLEAELEKLLESNKKPFVGVYRVKGNNHFVESESAGGNRWLFVPPPFRRRCQEGDFVLTELNKHPFDDGKASVKILNRIGAPGDDYIQHNLIIAQYGLNRFWSKDAQQQTDNIARNINLDDREDFTHIPFVTIDSATTRDMDDAVFVTPEENGWTLWVAIADPSHFIQPSSALAKAARTFGQSVYLPGRSLPMLPETLSAEVFSLLAETDRPALVCKIAVQTDGSLGEYEFKFGKIKSHAKLAYNDVALLLNGESSELDNLAEPLKTSLGHAADFAKARQAYRKEHQLTYDEQPDYELQLNKNGLIENIQKRERNCAHHLIEEAMLATNLCAGKYLSENNTGVFLSHGGFKTERIGEVKAVLRDDVGEEFAGDDIQTLEGYVKLIKHLQQNDSTAHLIAPLRRMAQIAEITTEPKPHLNMGVQHYATITSPIRRYVDLCNHWSIMQILAGKNAQQLPDKTLLQLNENLQAGRQASRALEQTLHGLYLKEQGEYTGKAIVRIVTQQGFGVRFLDSGIEGFVQFSKKQEKTYDAKRMTLTLGERTFSIDQTVEVKVTGVDLDRKRVKLALSGEDAIELEAKSDPA